MNKTTRTNLDNLWSDDRELQNKAFITILKATDKPVDWAYDAWDEVVANLSHKDNHNRAIAAQVLCNLAKSDPQGRILKDFDALLAGPETSASSPLGTACMCYGKLARPERNSRSDWSMVWPGASQSAPQRRTVR